MSTDLKVKILRLGKIGWKRIARNTTRFGWDLDEAVEEITTTTERTYEGTVYNDHIDIVAKDKVTKDKVIKLVFFRRASNLSKPNVVRTLEFFYNIIYFIRNILHYLVFPSLIFFVASAAINNFFGAAVFGGTLFSWLILRWVENLLSKIAEKYV